jgi:hypothetical protein
VLTETQTAAAGAFCLDGGSCTVVIDVSSALAVNCTDINPSYYQRAIYWAAGRDANGHRVSPPLHKQVVLSGGLHQVATLLPCWYPLGNSTGIHVPSGIHLSGSRGPQPTVIIPAPNSSTIEQLILISDERMGGPNMSIDQQLAPVRDAALRHVTLHGAPGVVSDPLACDSPQEIGSRVTIGISVSGGSAVTVSEVTVSGVSNSGINLGYFSQFIPEDPADKDNAGCSNASWCQGKRLLVLDAAIHNNIICAAMQGVTVIGQNVTVSNNTIALTTKTWTSSAQVFGITMGVSAGFVGSAEVSVYGNSIRGGDYSIGCDGSFPLYTTVPLFETHWEQMLTHYPDWAGKYPQGPVNNSVLIFQGNDFVLAQQVLLDLASSAHASSPDPAQNDAGFVSSLRLVHNRLHGSVAGVSLYRARDSLVSGNTIDSTREPLAMFGVSVVASHSNVISRNALSGWQVAIQAVGAPLGDPNGCGGCQARWGSSENSFLLNTVKASKAGVVLGYGGDAGRNNQVVSNTISADVQLPCDFSHAFDTTAADNIPGSCNSAR